jgi:hypothetical protein
MSEQLADRSYSYMGGRKASRRKSSSCGARTASGRFESLLWRRAVLLIFGAENDLSDHKFKIGENARFMTVHGPT